MISRLRIHGATAALVALAAMGGCATTIPAGAGKNPVDPYEVMNRRVTAFNDGFDHAVAQPAARAYNTVLPRVVRNCVSNFFDNIQEVANTIYATMQGRPSEVARDASRLVINTTVGFGGCFDVARQVGIERNRQNFGVTLGRWGVPAGPYLVLPVLGPSTVRQTGGLLLDYTYTSPIFYVRPAKDGFYLGGLQLLSDRAEVLEAGSLVDTASIDRYEFIRDAYLQRLNARVSDGNAPPAPLEDPDAPDPGEKAPADKGQSPGDMPRGTPGSE